MRAQWEAERTALREVQALRQELEQVRLESERAEREYDLNRAASLRHGRLPEIQRRLEAAESRLAEKQGGSACSGRSSPPTRSRPSWHGGRASRSAGSRKESGRSCCASTRCCTSVSSARTRQSSSSPTPSFERGRASRTRAARSGHSCSGPLASARPSSAKTAAAALFDSEDNMVRIDMSEYQERHSVSRLVGAPPGYVG